VQASLAACITLWRTHPAGSTEQAGNRPFVPAFAKERPLVLWLPSIIAHCVDHGLDRKSTQLNDQALIRSHVPRIRRIEHEI
jgi:hypothetical protein